MGKSVLGERVLEPQSLRSYLEIVILSEVSETEKEKYLMTFLTC